MGYLVHLEKTQPFYLPPGTREVFLRNMGSFRSSGVGIPLGKTICGVPTVYVVPLGLTWKKTRKLPRKVALSVSSPAPPRPAGPTSQDACRRRLASVLLHLSASPLWAPGRLTAQGRSQELLPGQRVPISPAETPDIVCFRIPSPRKSLLPSRLKIVQGHETHSF